MFIHQLQKSRTNVSVQTSSQLSKSFKVNVFSSLRKEDFFIIHISLFNALFTIFLCFFATSNVSFFQPFVGLQ